MEKLEKAVPLLEDAYENYLQNDSTLERLLGNVSSRFIIGVQKWKGDPEPVEITSGVIDYTNKIGEMRSKERY